MMVTTSTEWRALLKAIIQNPDEETPRLVLADWLVVLVQPERAEFIRTQAELARGGSNDRLLERQRALLARNGPAWVGPLGSAGAACGDGMACSDGGWVQWGSRFLFRRGFVDEVDMSPAKFARLAGRLFAANPIRVMHFPTGLQHRTQRGWLRPALARPELGPVSAIDLSHSWVDAGNLADLVWWRSYGLGTTAHGPGRRRCPARTSRSSTSRRPRRG
ncbi:MAG: hypothetical protein JWO38_887 [Gemmataceae bacterium]|nr:hypothetical protein [Gemmataceae bacterium]